MQSVSPTIIHTMTQAHNFPSNTDPVSAPFQSTENPKQNRSNDPVCIFYDTGLDKIWKDDFFVIPLELGLSFKTALFVSRFAPLPGPRWPPISS